MAGYAELQVTTHFSFLRGASSPQELFEQALQLGIMTIGITDHHSVAGVVQAMQAAEATGVRLVVGTHVDLEDGTALLLYPTDRAAYGRLCRLLSIGKTRAGKGACTLFWSDIADWHEGMLAILLPKAANDKLHHELTRLHALFGNRAWCALTRRFRPNDHRHLSAIAAMAAAASVPTIVTGDVLYHSEERRMLQDVVTCIRLKTTIDSIGLQKERHADRFLKSPKEMARLFARYPEAIIQTEVFAARCQFSLRDLTYTYPAETEDGITPQQKLERLTWAAVATRYPASSPHEAHQSGDPQCPAGLPDKVAMQLRHELSLIERMGYASYFLTVHAIVSFARSRGILCQGRGSAANSAVCYVLGVTSIDPVRQGLLFERFISEERREPPDIDVDFEHERREEIIQWIFETYGRTRSALTAVVSRYRSRGAVREVGKVLGVPEDVTGALAGLTWGWSREGVGEKQARELGLNLDDRRLRLTLDLAQQLIDTPRHLSQHPGGFVLTFDRLDELVPVEPAAMPNRQVIEWDKDDIDALKFMKVDVLGLGMLGCMRRAFDLLRQTKTIDLDLATIPAEDPATYAMITRADTIGVFQIESRAQMSMLPRMKPATFYDLVIEVAIVRPGPIQGDMVHPYLRRREGREAVVFPTEALRNVLGKTLGVPLFQEQAMQVAMVAASFTASEADQLRRAMATFKKTGGINALRDKLIRGMIGNGYEPEYADRTFRQLEGFGSYGFPESHAASFALIVYASSWMKCHHPDVFCAALLNAQPMGFYAPAQIVRDAREHHVPVHDIDINASDWDCTLESPDECDPDCHYYTVRLGMKMTKGLNEEHARRIIAARGKHPFQSINEIWKRAEASTATLICLAQADAFASLGLSRRQALWDIKALRGVTLSLFAAADQRENKVVPEFVEPVVQLEKMTAGRGVVEDYRSKSLTLHNHPVSFLRGELTQRGFASCGSLTSSRNGENLSVSGLILVRQRPGSAKGVMFITLEDETGIANLVVWPAIFEKQRRIVLSARMIGVRGRLQRTDQITHLVVEHFIDHSDLLKTIGGRDEQFPLPHGRGDEAKSGGGPDQRNPAEMRLKPRDIYIPERQVDDFWPELEAKARSFR